MHAAIDWSEGLIVITAPHTINCHKMLAIQQRIGTGHSHGDRSFRFRSKYIHCTYKGHIDMNILAAKASEVACTSPGGGVLRISIVHELGSETEAGGGDLRYPHTHMAVEWEKPLDKTNCRFMDVEVPVDFETSEVVHPNIQTKKSMPWFQNLIFEYHRGKKAQNGGGFKITPPVKLWQVGIDNWEKEREVMDMSVRAPTLVDACLLSGVTAKSVGDVVHLRNAVKKRSCEEALACCNMPWREPPQDWNRETHSLIVCGRSGIGKTNWAMAQFDAAYVISGLDDLKCVPQHATGLVFDDQEYGKLTLQDQKMIFDCRRATTVNQGVYTNKQKPHLPAIFTCNDLARLCDLLGDTGAIATRTYVWLITDEEKMYSYDV